MVERRDSMMSWVARSPSWRPSLDIFFLGLRYWLVGSLLKLVGCLLRTRAAAVRDANMSRRGCDKRVVTLDRGQFVTS